jgi:hypothetical protein
MSAILSVKISKNLPFCQSGVAAILSVQFLYKDVLGGPPRPRLESGTLWLLVLTNI